MGSARLSAVARRNIIIIGLLEKLGRCRPLEGDECALLVEMLNRSQPKNEGRWWTAEQDAALARVNSNWARFGRPQPYQQDDTIRNLAAAWGRSYFAVHRRLERLRKARGWKRPQMFKRARAKPGLNCANGQSRDTAADTGGHGRPASSG